MLSWYKQCNFDIIIKILISGKEGLSREPLDLFLKRLVCTHLNIFFLNSRYIFRNFIKFWPNVYTLYLRAKDWPITVWHLSLEMSLISRIQRITSIGIKLIHESGLCLRRSYYISLYWNFIEQICHYFYKTFHSTSHLNSDDFWAD